MIDPEHVTRFNRHGISFTPRSRKDSRRIASLLDRDEVYMVTLVDTHRTDNYALADGCMLYVMEGGVWHFVWRNTADGQVRTHCVKVLCWWRDGVLLESLRLGLMLVELCGIWNWADRLQYLLTDREKSLAGLPLERL